MADCKRQELPNRKRPHIITSSRHSFLGQVGPDKKPRQRQGEFPLRAASHPPSFPRCGDTQAVRGTATVWERGQMQDSICAVDSVRKVDKMAPTLRSLVGDPFPIRGDPAVAWFDRSNRAPIPGLYKSQRITSTAPSSVDPNFQNRPK